MQKNKGSGLKLKIIFSMLVFAIICVAEFYAIINFPEQYIVIVAFAVVILLCLFIAMKSYLEFQQIKDEQRQEEYENIVKAQKASYLLLKKYFEMINEKVDILQDTSKIPTEEIINAQKGVAKVIINRNRENAEALMNSNDLLMEQIDEFNKKLDGINEDVTRSVHDISQENFNQTIMKQQDIISGIKDMELHINQAIMQTQQIISSQPVQLTANVEIPQQAVAVPVSMPQMATMPQMAPIPQMEPVQHVEAIQVAEPAPIIEEATAEPAVEPIMEEMIAEPVMEEPAAESVAELEPEAEPELVAEPEPVVEEKPPMPDMSDPNKKMSPDDIAALFANMGGEADPVAESEPEAEPVAEPEPEAEPELVAEPEPVVEEKPPMPDMSDPNKKMSPDDIAALFANMGGDAEPVAEPEPITEPEPVAEPEPVVEEKPPMPDMSDPNKKMSPDDIAALFANMGGDAEPASEPEPVAEPEPELVAEPEPVVEEKPPMPDTSDPNKKMSPDEIAALIASMS